MENITIIQIEENDAVVDYVLIDRGNNEFTSMTKAEYDRQQAQQVEHLTEIPTPPAE